MNPLRLRCVVLLRTSCRHRRSTLCCRQFASNDPRCSCLRDRRDMRRCSFGCKATFESTGRDGVVFEHLLDLLDGFECVVHFDFLFCRLHVDRETPRGLTLASTHWAKIRWFFHFFECGKNPTRIPPDGFGRSNDWRCGFRLGKPQTESSSDWSSLSSLLSISFIR